MLAFLADALARGDNRLSAIRWLDACPSGSPVPGDVVQALLPQLPPPFARDFPADSTEAALRAAIKYAPQRTLESWVEVVLSTSGVTARERAIALTASRALEPLVRRIAGRASERPGQRCRMLSGCVATVDALDS